MDEEHIEEPAKSGKYLAYEREKRGFTAEDIAMKLHLSPHIIHAIEEETHDKLPELVYVRGYIRAYCRLLRIDPIPVLDMYTANLPQETDQLLEDLSPSSPINELQQKYIMIWGSVAVALIFLVLVIGWWQENRPADPLTGEPTVSQEEVPAAASESTVSQEEAVPAAASESTVSQEEAVPAAASESTVSQEEVVPAAANELSTSQEEAIPAAADELSTSQEEAVPAAADELSTSQEEAVPAAADELSTSQEGAAGQSETPDIPSQREAAQSPSDIETIDVSNDEIRPAELNTEAGTDLNDRQFSETDDMPEPVTLVITSREESWARITDGSSDIFVHRILPAGYNKIFMVNLPLKFEFGNAPQVSIMINGEDYDLSSYIRSNRVAVFDVTELP